MFAVAFAQDRVDRTVVACMPVVSRKEGLVVLKNIFRKFVVACVLLLPMPTAIDLVTHGLKGDHALAGLWMMYLATCLVGAFIHHVWHMDNNDVR